MLSFSKKFILMSAPFCYYAPVLLFFNLGSRHPFYHLFLLPSMGKINTQSSLLPWENQNQIPLSPHSVLALEAPPVFQIDLACPNLGKSSYLKTLIGGSNYLYLGYERVLVEECPDAEDSKEEVVDYALLYCNNLAFQAKTTIFVYIYIYTHTHTYLT